MWIDVRASGFEGNRPVSVYAEKRVRCSLGHLERGLEFVMVCLAYQNGPEGRQTRCRMLARPVPLAQVVVEETSTDPYAAIDRAAERLACAVELATRERGHPDHHRVSHEGGRDHDPAGHRG